jgi:2-polyprenyl-3-methyl-5-hydroxy-6-metoxy-1,4-benzoquinol methylase
MKKITLDPTWHEVWKCSYPYDLLEIYGDTNVTGYAYAYKNRRNHTLELIQKVAKQGAKILDVAAAQGNFSLLLAELGYEVTWNDLRVELMDYVKLKWEYGDLSYAPGNVLSQKFDPEFDVILMGEVIEHVAHPDEFLQEISKFLKPNGHILMTTPNCEIPASLKQFNFSQILTDIFSCYILTN